MTGSMSTLLLLGALSLLPFALVMLTSFVKISVVLHILRTALGAPQVPPTIVITGLAIILSGVVMYPTGQAVYRAVAATPSAVTSKGLDATTLLSPGSARVLLDAVKRAATPLQAFLFEHSRKADRRAFRDIARKQRDKRDAAAIGERDFTVVVPAFVVGQLTSAFKIGFLLFVPFLVIELLVANVLLALGMHMLAPPTIALPFKILLFVLVDGWALITQGLVAAYA